MTFLAPVFLIVAAGAAAAVVALHFIVMRQPPEDVFPTARFIPVRQAVARTVSRRPEDLVLLLLRTLAIIAIGAAFARPEWRERRVPVLHVAVVDRSRAVADSQEIVDSARRVVSGPSDVLVLFDSSARVIAAHQGDSLGALHPTRVRGVMSAALIAASRAAAESKSVADTIEITVISPAVAEEVDAATDSIRAVWPGQVRLVRVKARTDSAGVAAQVRWPADGHVDGARQRARVDTVTAVVAGRAVVVAPFARQWAVDTSGARVIARWVDGEPAAVERVAGARCVRDVVVPVPSEGDLVLRPEFRRFEAVIRASCGNGVTPAGAMPAAWNVDATRPQRVATSAIETASLVSNPIVAWLLTGAVVALLVELVLRRRGK